MVEYPRVPRSIMSAATGKARRWVRSTIWPAATRIPMARRLPADRRMAAVRLAKPADTVESTKKVDREKFAADPQATAAASSHVARRAARRGAGVRR